MNLSIDEYLEVLVAEYFSCKIRASIYPGRRDKVYWKKVMTYKKEAIEDIANKNSLPSIFSSNDEYLEQWGKIVPEWGFPLFYYNQRQGEDIKENDFRYYYYPETSFKFLSENGDILLGKFVSLLRNVEFAKIKPKNKEEEIILPVKRISRLLT